MTAALLVGLVAAASADDAPTRVSVEVDPLPYVFRGVEGVVSVQPAATPHVRFFGSAFTFPLPDAFLPSPAHSGRMVGTSLNAYWHVGEGARGLGFGGQVGYVLEQYGHAASPAARTAVSSVIVAPGAGFRWFPLKRGFYLYPWGRAGASLRVAARDEAVPEVEIPPVLTPSLYAALHLGWEFELRRR